MTLHRRSGRGLLAVAAAAGLAALAGPAAQAGPVQVISQERSVSASAGPELAEPVTAPDAGRFNESVSDEDVTAEREIRASASMDSTLGADAFTFSGSLSYATDEAEATGTASATASATAIIVFALDEPRRFSLTRETVITGEDNPFDFFEFPLEFTSDGEPGTGGSLEDVTSDGDDLAGTLLAGQYRLVVPLQLSSEGSDEQLRSTTVDYDVTLDFSPVDDGGDGGTPIPLPPAVWSGLALMGAGLVNRWRNSRLG